MAGNQDGGHTLDTVPLTTEMERVTPIYDEVRQAIFDYYRTTYGENSPQYREALPGKSGHTNGKFEALARGESAADTLSPTARKSSSHCGTFGVNGRPRSSTVASCGRYGCATLAASS